jgi:hypothetical protein
VPAPPANTTTDKLCSVTHPIPATGQTTMPALSQQQSSGDPATSFLLLIPNLFVADVAFRRNKSGLA